MTVLPMDHVYCQHSWSCLNPATTTVNGRHYCCEHAGATPHDHVVGGIPRIYSDDYGPPGCMCDFEGHTRTGCTHES